MLTQSNSLRSYKSVFVSARESPRICRFRFRFLQTDKMFAQTEKHENTLTCETTKKFDKIPITIKNRCNGTVFLVFITAKKCFCHCFSYENN